MLIRDTESLVIELRSAKMRPDDSVVTVAWKDPKTEYSITYANFRVFCNSILNKYVTGGE